MTFKLIAIDLDGTLLSPRGEVTPRSRHAVRKIREAGLKICFATGRNLTESQRVLKAVDHYDLAVFIGGAMVIDTRDGRTLHRTLMNAQLARELSGFFEIRKLAVLALQDTGRAGVDYMITDGIALSDATQKWLKDTRSAVHWSTELATHPHEHTLRLGVVAPVETAAQLHRDLDETFGKRIVSHSLLIPAYGVQVLEVFDPMVNKWEGLRHVSKHYGIEASEIIAIGDDVNDVPMVKNAGLGLAMANGHPELLAIAKRVIGHNRDDGLAIYLEELLAAG